MKKEKFCIQAMILRGKYWARQPDILFWGSAGTVATALILNERLFGPAKAWTPLCIMLIVNWLGFIVVGVGGGYWKAFLKRHESTPEKQAIERKIGCLLGEEIAKKEAKELRDCLEQQQLLQIGAPADANPQTKRKTTRL